MKFINFFLLRHLSKYFQVKEKKYFHNDSFGIVMGENSFIEKPSQIDGGKYIIIKNNSSVGHSAWLGAFESYLDQKFTPSISIGNNVRIGNYACITSIDTIDIGDGCLFSEYVYISDHYHGIDPSIGLKPAKQPLFSKGKVVIGNNTFIGYRVTILSGVVLGKNCVVGAHSVVNKSFPDYSMIAGIPAKLIKRYSKEKKCWVSVNNKNI